MWIDGNVRLRFNSHRGQRYSRLSPRSVSLEMVNQNLQAAIQRPVRPRNQGDRIAEPSQYLHAVRGRTNYLVMEMIEGPTLADRIRTGALGLGETADIMVTLPSSALACKVPERRGVKTFFHMSRLRLSAPDRLTLSLAVLGVKLRLKCEISRSRGKRQNVQTPPSLWAISPRHNQAHDPRPLTLAFSSCKFGA